MSPKLVFALAFLVVAINSVLSCSPNIQAFQLANRHRPCTQCQEILTTNSCSSDIHDPIFECSQPSVAYSTSFSEKPCARATIVCNGKRGVEQSSVIVAKIASNSSVEVFGAISTLQSPNAHLIMKCDSESNWIYTDLDDNVLAQPLTIQCAHNRPDKVFGELIQ